MAFQGLYDSRYVTRRSAAQALCPKSEAQMEILAGAFLPHSALIRLD